MNRNVAIILALGIGFFAFDPVAFAGGCGGCGGDKEAPKACEGCAGAKNESLKKENADKAFACKGCHKVFRGGKAVPCQDCAQAKADSKGRKEAACGTCGKSFKDGREAQNGCGGCPGGR